MDSMSINPFVAPDELRKVEAAAWKSPVMMQEPVVLFSVGDVLVGSLLFDPERIIAIEAWNPETKRFEQVSSALLKEVETQPKPGGTGSRLLVHSRSFPHLIPSDVYQPLGTPLAYPSTRDKKSGLLFSENGYFHEKSILVTYKHDNSWSSMVPGFDPSCLPALRNILVGKSVGKKTLDLFVLGDSISTGANCSAQLGLFPKYHGYPDLVAGMLQQRLPGAEVRLANESLGGTNAEWGRKTLLDRIDAARKKHPRFAFDVNIIAFGANDAGGRRPARKYVKDIVTMIEDIQQVNPHGEFIIVTSSLMNDLWIHGHNDVLLGYRAEIHKVATKLGNHVAIADATQLWQDTLARKSYYDLTGNGLNHPNDFGHRLYAQVIGELLPTHS